MFIGSHNEKFRGRRTTSSMLALRMGVSVSVARFVSMLSGCVIAARATCTHSCPVGEKQVFPCSLKRMKTLPGNLQQLFPWVFFGQNWDTCILPLIFLGCSVPRISHFLFTLVTHLLKHSTNIYWLATMCWVIGTTAWRPWCFFFKKFVFSFPPPVTVLLCIFLSSFSKRKHFFRSMTELLTVDLEEPVSFRKLSP